MPSRQESRLRVYVRSHALGPPCSDLDERIRFHGAGQICPSNSTAVADTTRGCETTGYTRLFRLLCCTDDVRATRNDRECCTAAVHRELDIEIDCRRTLVVVDIVSPSTRSRMMAAVPQADSTPELVVRRVLHAMGYRFRLHRRDLPGSPDIALPKYRKVVFVHGCFWHQHGCRKTTTPSSNVDFWYDKFAQNKSRDRRNRRELKEMGWESLVVWECQTRKTDWLYEKLIWFLSS